MTQKINTIIFDLGGVLVDWNPAHLYKEVFNGDLKKTKWFLDNICTNAWNAEQDGGRTIADGNALKIKEFPEYEDYIKLYYKEWPKMFNGPINENVEIFKKLKKSGNYKIYALTNWSAEKWDKALELFPFFNDFDGVVVSGQEKTRKPFFEIYTLLLERFNIDPEHAIFIDDNLDNINAANKLNIHGIHFNNNTNLKDELNHYNIIY